MIIYTIKLSDNIRARIEYLYCKEGTEVQISILSGKKEVDSITFMSDKEEDYILSNIEEEMYERFDNSKDSVKHFLELLTNYMNSDLSSKTVKLSDFTPSEQMDILRNRKEGYTVLVNSSSDYGVIALQRQHNIEIRKLVNEGGYFIVKL